MYLTNSPKHPGAFTFSGYDLENYAVDKAKDDDITWHKLDKINMQNFWTIDAYGLFDNLY